MSDELNEEVDRGTKLAEALVEHAQTMGCAMVRKSVVVNGEWWDVEARYSKMNDSVNEDA